MSLLGATWPGGPEQLSRMSIAMSKNGQLPKRRISHMRGLNYLSLLSVIH